MNKKILYFFFCSLIYLFYLASAYAQDKSGKPSNAYFYIKSVQSESLNAGYWDQPGVPVKFERGARLGLYAKDNNIDQQFRFIKAGGGLYYIESKNGGLVDVESNKSANGTRLQVWSGHGGSNQLFRIKHLGGGRWKIYTAGGRVISTPRDFSNGTVIHIWEDHDGPWTEWFFEDAKTGKIFIP